MPKVVRKQKPPVLLKYRDYKKYLRIDFQYRCAYCHIPEARNGPPRNYAVEHFRPKGKPEFAHLICEYSNLYYACHSCNDAKGARWPTQEEAASGRRFLDPCIDDYCAHFEITETGVAKPLTSEGRYTEAHLLLNRDSLKAWRARKPILTQEIDSIRDLLAECDQDPDDIRQLPTARKVLRTLKAGMAKLIKTKSEEFSNWWRP